MCAASMAAVGLAASAASAATTPVGQVTEFSAGLSPGAEPEGITTGPDGNVWFTDGGNNRIGRITPQGVITEFGQLPAPSRPNSITSGPDGNLWFTDLDAGRIGRISTSGVMPAGGTGITANAPYGIASGPDGNLWVTENTTGNILRVTPQGGKTPFSTLANSLTYIARGPDGNMWFTSFITPTAGVGSITTGGAVTLFAQGLSPDASPLGITAGPDGNVWFTDPSTDSIGRITPQGTITTFSAGITPGMRPRSIALGPDGNLWFVGRTADRVGRITPQGQVTEFSAGISPNSSPWVITAGPDGNMWFTESGGGRIARITSGAVRALTVTKSGTGAGAVTSSPAGIDCGPTCTSTPDYLQEVTLTATVTGGSTFAGWGGACSGTSTCMVSMSEARSVSAAFTAGTPPVVKPKKLAGAFRFNSRTRVGTTTGTVPTGVTRIIQTARTGDSAATQGFLEMAKAKTARGKCSITVVRNKRTKKVTKRSYRCTIRLAKGAWTVSTTARGKAGVVAEGTRRVVVKK